jgi:hypothetical protein
MVTKTTAKSHLSIHWPTKRDPNAFGVTATKDTTSQALQFDNKLQCCLLSRQRYSGGGDTLRCPLTWWSK